MDDQVADAEAVRAGFPAGEPGVIPGAEGEERPQGEFRSDAPAMPWVVALRQFAVSYTHLPDGGMILHLNPVAQTPRGWLPMPPGVEAIFNPQAWERFQREVAAGGERSKVQTVPAAAMPRTAVLPPGVRG